MLLGNRCLTGRPSLDVTRRYLALLQHDNLANVTSDLRGALENAIGGCRIIRLGYVRASDGLVTLHRVAPVDIRPGDTPRFATTEYLWAFCYEESKLERHLVNRIVSVTPTPDAFDPRDLFRSWPEGWYVPKQWVIPRVLGNWEFK